jgi:hypothetical protein
MIPPTLEAGTNVGTWNGLQGIAGQCRHRHRALTM